MWRRREPAQLGDLAFAVVAATARGGSVGATVPHGQGEQGDEGEEDDPCGHGRKYPLGQFLPTVAEKTSSRQRFCQ